MMLARGLAMAWTNPEIQMVLTSDTQDSFRVCDDDEVDGIFHLLSVVCVVCRSVDVHQMCLELCSHAVLIGE